MTPAPYFGGPGESARQGSHRAQMVRARRFKARSAYRLACVTSRRKSSPNICSGFRRLSTARSCARGRSWFPGLRALPYPNRRARPRSGRSHRAARTSIVLGLRAFPAQWIPQRSSRSAPAPLLGSPAPHRRKRHEFTNLTPSGSDGGDFLGQHAPTRSYVMEFHTSLDITPPFWNVVVAQQKSVRPLSVLRRRIVLTGAGRVADMGIRAVRQQGTQADRGWPGSRERRGAAPGASIVSGPPESGPPALRRTNERPGAEPDDGTRGSRNRGRARSRCRLEAPTGRRSARRPSLRPSPATPRCSTADGPTGPRA